MAVEAKRSVLQKLRDGPVGRAVDKGIEASDKFLGPSGKAWLANGLDELRQALALGPEQVQAGNNPGLWGTITTGEATAERMAGDRDKQAALRASYEVPGTEPTTLDKVRGHRKEPGQDPSDGMDHGPERGGIDM